MTAILRRELSAYFYSPIGYIFLSVFYVFSGFYFFAACLANNSSNVGYVYSSLLIIVLFLVPILTMRLFSEDKRQRTDQALLTAPVSLTGLVLGKFLAATVVYLLGLGMTLVYGVIVALFTPANWAMIFGNFIALALLGMSFISIGMFISSLTENQVIAAIGGFATALALVLLDSMAGFASNPVMQKLITGISFFSRYGGFSTGKFEISSVVFFLSVSAIFCFLTVRVMEKKRWS